MTLQKSTNLSSEYWVRNYALHVGLRVRRRGNKLTLYEHYEAKRKIGEFRSWRAVEHAIEKYGDDWLRDNADAKEVVS